MSMKNVARIELVTDRNRYVFTIPNVTHEETKKIVDDARKRAHEVNKIREADGAVYSGIDFVFDFPEHNEYLEINGFDVHVHHFIKQENYPFDTPTINVYQR